MGAVMSFGALHAPCAHGSTLCLEGPVQWTCHALEASSGGHCCAPRMEGSRVECRMRIKKGLPCKLNSPNLKGWWGAEEGPS